jgi:hypothetical protein
MMRTSILAAFLVACGSTTPTTTTPPSGSSSATPPASATPSASAATSSTAPSGPTMESQRAPFVETCMKRVPSQNYCGCGFDQFREVFKDQDLTKSPDPALLATWQSRTVAACADKLTPDEAKSSFSLTCVAGDTRKAPYCDCAWGMLAKKKLSNVDLLGDMAEPRFDEVKKGIATTCKGKLPDAVVKADFMTGCTKGDPSHAGACECVWKKIRAKYAPEEFATGIADLKSIPHVEECKGK